MPNDFDLESTRRDLIAMRVKFGADTPKGHACSNLIEQLQNYEIATPEAKAHHSSTRCDTSLTRGHRPTIPTGARSLPARTDDCSAMP